MFGFSKYKNLPLGDITENCKYGDFAPCLDEWTDIGRLWPQLKLKRLFFESLI